MSHTTCHTRMRGKLMEETPRERVLSIVLDNQENDISNREFCSIDNFPEIEPILDDVATNDSNINKSLDALVKILSNRRVPFPSDLMFLVPRIWEIINDHSEDEEIMILCLSMFLFLTHGDFSEECPFIKEEFALMLKDCLSSPNHEIRKRACNLCCNLLADTNVQYEFTDLITYVDFLPELYDLCTSNEREYEAVAFKILSNYVDITSEMEKDLSIFGDNDHDFIPVLLDQLKRPKRSSMRNIASPLARLMSEDESCCEYVIYHPGYTLRDILRNAVLEGSDLTAVPDLFFMINLVIEKEEKSDAFVDEKFLRKTCNLLEDVDASENRPLFVFIDNMIDSMVHWDMLLVCTVLEKIRKLADSGLYDQRRRCCFVAVHMIDNIMDMPRPPEWLSDAFRLVIDTMESLSESKMNTTLMCLISWVDRDPVTFIPLLHEDAIIGDIFAQIMEETDNDDIIQKCEYILSNYFE